MYVATGEFDLLFGEVPSLKAKRGLVRPLVAELRRRFDVSCGEVGDADLLRRAVIGVAVVSNDAAVARGVVERCEGLIAARPECDLLAARVRLFRPGEDFRPDR
jgi:uncharacterized protein YlxP (DUF503 family)